MLKRQRVLAGVKIRCDLKERIASFLDLELSGKLQIRKLGLQYRIQPSQHRDRAICLTPAFLYGFSWPFAEEGQLIAIAALSWYSWHGTLRCWVSKSKTSPLCLSLCSEVRELSAIHSCRRRPAERTIATGEYHVKTRRENKCSRIRKVATACNLLTQENFGWNIASSDMERPMHG